MPSVRLFLQESTPVVPCDYLEPGGGMRRHPLLRLTASVVIVPRPGTHATAQSDTGLIDTGAWISAVRPNAWEAFAAEGLIEVLIRPDDPQAPRASLAGVTARCGLGRLRVRVVGPPRPGSGSNRSLESLPAVPVLAQLLTDPRLNDEKKMKYPILLGLHGGILDGRRLVREPVPARATGRATDAGPTYGQDWFLETP